MSEYIRLEGRPEEIPCRFPLELVGIDWDGEIRPIDELSYTPRPEPIPPPEDVQP